MSKKIDGRKAEIINYEKWYDLYSDFSEKHGYPDAAHSFFHHSPDTRKRLQDGDIVTLLVSGEHEIAGEGTLWIVEAANGERHIFNEKGLRILDEESAPISGITVLPDESLGGTQREYREVKRKARVGERIKIINNGADHGLDIGRVCVADNADSAEGWLLYHVEDAAEPDYAVLEPTDVVYVDGRKYRMVDRKAAVGDYVLITSGSEYLRKGALIPFNKRAYYASPAVINYVDGEYGTAGAEFIVLEPLNSAPTAPLSTRPATDQIAENIVNLQAQNDALTAKVQTLESRLDALYAWHKRAAVDLRVAREDIVLIEEGVSGDIERLEKRIKALEPASPCVKVASGHVDTTPPSFMLPQKSAQEIRDEIVERAKFDVKALLSRVIEDVPCVNTGKTATYSPDFDEIDFVINRDKRKVTAIIRTRWSPKTWAIGRSKCAPNDVFNAHIGRAIALRRALGLEVPAEYLSVPEPEIVRVGDVVTYDSVREYGTEYVVTTLDKHGWNLRIVRDENGDMVGETAKGGDLNDGAAIIIDDSREGEITSSTKGVAA